MKTVLDNVTKEHIKTDPFAHVVLHDALEQSVAMQLTEVFPPTEVVAQRTNYNSNDRFSLTAHKALADESVPDVWKEFIRTNSSQEFLNAALLHLGEGIRTTYPDIEKRFGPMSSWKAGIRGVDSYDSCDVLLDAQISVNTPVTGKATSVRVAHVDVPNKLFAGLLYLRHPNDTSEGGDLHIYKWSDGVAHQFYNKQYAPMHFVEHVSTVPYQNNTMIFFVNSDNALHGVTPRHAAEYPRLFVNFVAELREPLFDLDSMKEAPLSRVRRKLSRMLS